MSRIYFRGGMSPLDTFTPGYVLTHDVLGTNSGNLLYQYGVLRALTMEDSELQPNYYRMGYLSPEEVNEKFDYFVIPLADAFREKFVSKLDEMTAYIKRLRIPCVVTGVGLKASYEPDYTAFSSLDEPVREFVKVVLEKSACIGVRGEITGNYLKSLGFIEDKDYMVIGCPSMYSHGSGIQIKEPDFSRDARICFNSNVDSQPSVNQYLLQAIENCSNPYFIEQTVTGLRTVYMGSPYHSREVYPYQDVTDKLYQEGRVIQFLNVPEWMQFMKESSFAFGSRLHGNISATISGTPSILVLKDARTRELAEYHKFNSVLPTDLSGNPSLEELASRQDFGQIGRRHRENFERFVKFLDKNELKHIYQNGEEPEVSPLERRMQQVEHEPPVLPLAVCSVEEQARRYQDYFRHLDAKMNRLAKKASKEKPVNKTEQRDYSVSSVLKKCYRKILR